MRGTTCGHTVLRNLIAQKVWGPKDCIVKDRLKVAQNAFMDTDKIKFAVNRYKGMFSDQQNK